MSPSNDAHAPPPPETTSQVLLGLAVIAYSIERENDPVRKGAFQFVLDGAREKHRVSRKALDDYLVAHRELVERTWEQRIPRKGGSKP